MLTTRTRQPRTPVFTLTSVEDIKFEIDRLMCSYRWRKKGRAAGLFWPLMYREDRVSAIAIANAIAAFIDNNDSTPKRRLALDLAAQIGIPIITVDDGMIYDISAHSHSYASWTCVAQDGETYFTDAALSDALDIIVAKHGRSWRANLGLAVPAIWVFHNLNMFHSMFAADGGLRFALERMHYASLGRDLVYLGPMTASCMFPVGLPIDIRPAYYRWLTTVVVDGAKIVALSSD